jgi:hypothetical protein
MFFRIPEPTFSIPGPNFFLLLLLLLNRLPPDITGGQGLNGFQKLLFFTILQKFYRREMIPQW